MPTNTEILHLSDLKICYTTYFKLGFTIVKKIYVIFGRVHKVCLELEKANEPFECNVIFEENSILETVSFDHYFIETDGQISF